MKENHQTYFRTAKLRKLKILPNACAYSNVIIQCPKKLAQIGGRRSSLFIAFSQRGKLGAFGETRGPDESS